MNTLRNLSMAWGFIFVFAFIMSPTFVWAESLEPKLEKAFQAFDRGDYNSAFRLFSELAEQGNPIAQSTLGLFYHNGLGVPQDYKQAVKWFRKAADQGIPAAQYKLGQCYYHGQGPKPQNI